MMFCKVLLVAFAVFWSEVGADLENHFRKCKADDERFNSCLKDAVQDALSKFKVGVPEYNIPPQDVIRLPEVTIGEGNGVIRFEQKYKNFDLFNFTDAMITKVEAKVTPNIFDLVLESVTPFAGFEADYNFAGQFLLLSLQGEGRCRILLHNMTIGARIYAEPYEKKGKSYFKVENVTLELGADKMLTRLENLFNGNKQLSDEMHKVLNDNWKDVFEDVKSGYENVFAVLMKQFTMKLFGKIPIQELFY